MSKEAVTVAGRIEHGEHEVADCNCGPFLELVIDGARLHPIVHRVDAGSLGHVKADCLFVGEAEAFGYHSRGVDGRIPEQAPHSRGPSRMVAVPMSEDDVTNARRVESVALHILDNGRRSHACTDIDERELASPVDEVNVAVVGIREVEALGARAHKVDAVRQSHGASKLKLSCR
jgi:hypothetical protein